MFVVTSDMPEQLDGIIPTTTTDPSEQSDILEKPDTFVKNTGLSTNNDLLSQSTPEISTVGENLQRATSLESKNRNNLSDDGAVGPSDDTGCHSNSRTQKIIQSKCLSSVLPPPLFTKFRYVPNSVAKRSPIYADCTKETVFAITGNGRSGIDPPFPSETSGNPAGVPHPTNDGKYMLRDKLAPSHFISTNSMPKRFAVTETNCGNRYLRLNVGGVPFQISKQAVAQYSRTRLGLLAKLINDQVATRGKDEATSPKMDDKQGIQEAAGEQTNYASNTAGVSVEPEFFGETEKLIVDVGKIPNRESVPNSHRASVIPQICLTSTDETDFDPDMDSIYDYYNEETDEYYFDRSPYSFDAISSLYRNGCVHVPDFYCADLFADEMNYWMVGSELVGECCLYKIPYRTLQYVSGSPNISRAESINLMEPEDRARDASNTPRCSVISREFVWEHMDNPKSSKLAYVFNIISILFVLTTMFCLILSSMPQFREPYQNEESGAEKKSMDLNETTGNKTTMNTEPRITLSGLEIADMVCVCFFTLEFGLRWWASPNRLTYLKTFMFWIDFFAVFPFYIEIAMKFGGYKNKAFIDIRKSLLMIRILRALRVMRVLRILKIARFSKGFQSVGKTVQKSWRELTMLILFLLTTNVMFSTVMYFLECDQENSNFESIPASAWWCIITMTTVGYGDVYPKTVMGKIVAAIVSIVGIILLAFPISVIVEHFHEEYTTGTGDEPGGIVSNPGELPDVSGVEGTSQKQLTVKNCLNVNKLNPNDLNDIAKERSIGDDGLDMVNINPNKVYRQTFLALTPKQLSSGVMVCELNPLLAQMAHNGTFDPSLPNISQVVEPVDPRPKPKRKRRRGFKL